jgi:hypothetical protein
MLYSGYYSVQIKLFREVYQYHFHEVFIHSVLRKIDQGKVLVEILAAVKLAF